MGTRQVFARNLHCAAEKKKGKTGCCTWPNKCGPMTTFLHFEIFELFSETC